MVVVLFLLGLVYGNASEWLLHRFLLHGLGASKDSAWAFHWHDHHKTARQQQMLDEKYKNRLFSKWDPQAKEAAGLLAGAFIHLPLLWVAPGFVAGVFASALLYYFVHRQSHLDEAWAQRWVPWHWDHHMGPNQHANWCVTFPLFDHLLRTRQPYFNTADEVAGRERRRAFYERRKQAAAAPAEASQESL